MNDNEIVARVARDIAHDAIDRARRMVNNFSARRDPRDATERTLFQAFDIADGFARGVEWETGDDAMREEMERLRHAVCDRWVAGPEWARPSHILALRVDITALEAMGMDAGEERAAWDAAWGEYQRTYDTSKHGTREESDYD